jgi:hypothetical protein
MAKAPYGECARCGFKRRVTELKPPRVKPEGVPVHNAAPETEPVFAKLTDGSHL